MTKIEAYCACGGAVKGTMSGNPEKARKTIEIFRELHTMAGCKPCDSATARKARKEQKQTKRKPVY